MNLTYRENYWDSLPLKQEFICFLTQLFGLDLSLWDEMGFWDNQYRPFSYFDDKALVANVCLYSMDMTIQGEQCRVAQISAVGTAAEYRRQGLSFKLMQKAIEWAADKHDFFFLFADDDAYPLYKKSGFQKVDEYKPIKGG